MTALLVRPSLRLLPRNLSERDVAKIGAFLRVGHDRFLCDWSVVRDGSCHVMVLGSSQQEPTGQAERNPTPILHVCEACEGQRADALVRPLQYDAFVDALTAVERKLVPPSTTSVRVVPAMLPTPVVVEPRRALPVPPAAGLRLRRWPPASILYAHRYNVRLASFMSGRHVSQDELAQLSNVDPSLCEQFLVTLSDAGLLDVQKTEAIECAPRLVAVDAGATARNATPEHGLLNRIRNRLGLGRSQ